MTGSHRVITAYERFRRSVVWHPIHTDPADDYRHGPRFWYPGYDVIAVGLGIYAVALGSPLLNRLFPEWAVTVLGVGIMVSAVMALVGVIFPRLFMVELAGKFGIVFMLGGYAGTVAFLTPQENNGFVVIVLVMAVWLLGPRVTWLTIRTMRWIMRRKG